MAKAPVKKKPPVKKAKPPSGTLTERMGEAKSRPNKGLPAKIDKSRGNLNRANPPKEIRLGGQGGTGRSLTRAAYLDKFKAVPLGDRPKLLSGPKVKGGGVGGALARGLFRAVGGPATMLVSMTTEAGSGSDKPSGKLFSPSQNRAAGKGNPKTVNRYNPARKIGAVKGAAGTAMGSFKPSVSMSGGGVNRPESKAMVPKPKERPPVSSVSKPKAPKPTARPSVSPKAETFAQATRRNTADQYLRNKMKPKSNLLSLIRNKKKG